MAVFMKLLAALEILLFLKKLREQNESSKTKNYSSSIPCENQVPEEHQSPTDGHAQIWKK